MPLGPMKESVYLLPIIAFMAGKYSRTMGPDNKATEIKTSRPVVLVNNRLQTFDFHVHSLL